MLPSVSLNILFATCTTFLNHQILVCLQVLEPVHSSAEPAYLERLDTVMGT
jgi:hypothetical protein